MRVTMIAASGAAQRFVGNSANLQASAQQSGYWRALACLVKDTDKDDDDDDGLALELHGGWGFSPLKEVILHPIVTS